ncbi:transmembrane protein, putative (macronuclear) [Tetrahymena thermophila SB210]|uniref:Transmembrane protein, putative n=1 Tax=Tetrahymena thermophila (strain SB210) TaxID=312017 RepID=W7XK42_TETTS|nr:transmembrane protein, putative [Tetrahymena thermophila SB210]EWS74579.1 transmembrane protein, putative [Tetrahymena thermophila SB210]|eukprot:XP_012652880.1 transmembrane protein, putative [Tetrahymena thermophila SB210]
MSIFLAPSNRQLYLVFCIQSLKGQKQNLLSYKNFEIFSKGSHHHIILKQEQSILLCYQKLILNNYLKKSSGNQNQHLINYLICYITKINLNKCLQDPDIHLSLLKSKSILILYRQIYLYCIHIEIILLRYRKLNEEETSTQKQTISSHTQIYMLEGSNCMYQIYSQCNQLSTNLCSIYLKNLMQNIQRHLSQLSQLTNKNYYQFSSYNFNDNQKYKSMCRYYKQNQIVKHKGYLVHYNKQHNLQVINNLLLRAFYKYHHHDLQTHNFYRQNQYKKNYREVYLNNLLLGLLILQCNFVFFFVNNILKLSKQGWNYIILYSQSQVNLRVFDRQNQLNSLELNFFLQYIHYLESNSILLNLNMLHKKVISIIQSGKIQYNHKNYKH